MGETIDAGRIALIFVQLFGEELFKINMLLGILLLLFRRSNNRKSAVAANQRSRARVEALGSRNATCRQRPGCARVDRGELRAA